MFGFGFKKVETVPLAETLAAKRDEVLRSAWSMLTGTEPAKVAREEALREVHGVVLRNMPMVETLLGALPDLLWKTILAALEKGPQTLTAPSELDGEARAVFFDECAEMYSGLFFVHVFPDRAEAGAPRLAVAEEIRKAWKDNRRENLARREAWDRVCRLAQGAANLYGCIDVDRFVPLAGDAIPRDAEISSVRQQLELRTQFEDGSLVFLCRDGEILHRDLGEDALAHARVRRAHVGKDPLPATADDLRAWADDAVVSRTEAFRKAVKAFEQSMPKALAGEAQDVVAGFVNTCRKGDDVSRTMAQLVSIATLSSGGAEVHLDAAGFSPLYNSTPLWEEFGRTREQVGKAREFSIGGTSGSTQVNDGPQVGRNDPCPCGSGKKFKKCCGRGL